MKRPSKESIRTLPIRVSSQIATTLLVLIMQILLLRIRPATRCYSYATLNLGILKKLIQSSFKPRV